MTDKKDDNKKLISIEGKKKTKRTPIEELYDGLPYILEYQKIYAQITRTRFIALIKEGFTKEQALELCKKNPLSVD